MHSPSNTPEREDAISQLDETTPLLVRDNSKTSPNSEANSPETGSYDVPRSIFLRAIICTFTAVLLLNLGNWLSRGPLVRLIESILCDHYYEKTFPGEDFGASSGKGIPEELCKVDEIQDGVARLFGWQHLFDSIPSILLAIPYGMLADWYGRKLVMVLSMVGILLQAMWVLFVCKWKAFLGSMASSVLLLDPLYLTSCGFRLYQSPSGAVMDFVHFPLHWWRIYCRNFNSIRKSFILTEAIRI
jgi:hypothetical protein